MTDTSVPPMHQDFGAWYSTVNLDDEQELREVRWDGLSTVVCNANPDALEGLLRLAHRSRHRPRQVVLEEIRRAFRDADEMFPMSGNDRELEVLAGACLAVAMESTNATGGIAALASTTAAFGGARRPDLPMDLETLGEAAITRIGSLRRQRPATSHKGSRRGPTFDFSKAAGKAREGGSFEAVAEALELAGNTTRDAMKRLVRTQDEAMDALHRFLRVQDEELDMLWWLTARRSEDYSCDFDSIPADAQPLVLAKELADMTGDLPGPVSVAGILSRTGLQAEKLIVVAEAVSAAEPEWLQKVIGERTPSPVTTPLHDGIRRQLETGQGQSWTEAWAATVGVPADYGLPGLTLAQLFYRECLLTSLQH